MQAAYRNCQSCGMPLKRDEEHGGTEADGSRSATYCSHCYRQGRFVLPDLTVRADAAAGPGKLTEFHIPGSWPDFLRAEFRSSSAGAHGRRE